MENGREAELDDMQGVTGLSPVSSTKQKALKPNGLSDIPMVLCYH